MTLLLLLFLIPFAASLAVLFFPFPSRSAFLLSLIPLAILLSGIPNWNGAEIALDWFPALSIQFALKVDTLSQIFLFLTAIIIPISLLAVRKEEENLPRLFYFFVLLTQSLLIGFFTASDLFLFTFFWEAMIIPLYFILSLWGSEKGTKAAVRFFLYMFAGSVLLIAAILSLYFLHDTFNIEQLAQSVPLSASAPWIFLIFVLAFAVKTPLFPFHGWLPSAYCEASTAGTILLSGLLSKAGIYGFYRIAIPLFPAEMQQWSMALMSLAVVGVLYGAFAAWMQQDFKRLLAYSSFSHVNLVLAGIFILDKTANTGAILQAFNHGITITALFFVAGWLEQRLQSTGMDKAGGLAHHAPRLCWMTLFFVLSSVGLPGLNNFIGEILIFFGFFTEYIWMTTFLVFTVVLSVVYMLRWMQMIYFQSPANYTTIPADLHFKEMLQAVPLILLILWIGIYPAPLLQPIDLFASHEEEVLSFQAPDKKASHEEEVLSFQAPDKKATILEKATAFLTQHKTLAED